MGAAGSFVAVNNRVSQSVPHLHTHVVPRNRKDGLRGFFWPRGKYADDAEAAAVAGRLREAVARAVRARSGLTARRRRTVMVAGTPSRSSGSPARPVRPQRDDLALGGAGDDRQVDGDRAVVASPR